MAAKARRPVRRIPKGRRSSVPREEFNKVIELLNERGELLNRLLHDQHIQFQRIAQMQAEIDAIKRSLARSRPDTANDNEDSSSPKPRRPR